MEYILLILAIFPRLRLLITYCMSETVKNLPTMQEIPVRALGRDDPLEKGMAARSGVLAGESHGQRSLAGCSPRAAEADTTDTVTFFTLLCVRLCSKHYLFCKSIPFGPRENLIDILICVVPYSHRGY